MPDVVHSPIPALTDMVLAIDTCYRDRRILPTLILLYSLMDVIGSLETPKGTASKKSFIWWADRYVIPAGPLPCKAVELYGARCGVLHTLSAESDLSHGGHARRILYAWGSVSAGDLARTASILESSDVAIHVTDLIDALRRGLAEYFEDVARDQERQSVVTARVNQWLAHMPTSVMSDFLRELDGLD